MNNKIENVIPISHPENSTLTGRVANLADDIIYLKLNEQVILARKAFSCLIEPKLNDTVLFSFDENQQAYVIAILHRDNDQSAVLKMPSNTILNCEENLTIQSGNKTSLLSPSILQVSDKSIIKTNQAVMNFESAVVKGEKLHGYFQSVFLVADMMSSMAKQAIQKFTSYIRKTEQADQVQAGQMGRKVHGLYSLDSKHTILVSKKETKIDGEHIHMG